MIKIGINGLGRIGRLVLRAALEDNNIEIALLNTPGSAEVVAHLLKYDSVHGTWNFECDYSEGKININGKKIPISAYKNPLEIPAKNIDVMLECSGKFNRRQHAEEHLKAGAKKVIVSAPCENADSTIVVGVNDRVLTKEHDVISIGSCTTNALAPIAKIMNDNFGIENGYVTTIHAYTGDQNIVDNSHKDIRRARCASMSMIPTKTGAAEALKLVLPELEGKIFGSAVRVPTPNVSMLDMVLNLSKPASKETINKAINEAASGEMKNIISVAKARLVSVDFNHSPYSSIFDPFETYIISERVVRLVSWYDNEWGFAKRMIDAAKLIYRQI